MMRRVFVTGLSVVGAFGDDLEAFWTDCQASRSVVEPIPERWFDFADYRSTIWSPVSIPAWPELFSRVERIQHDAVTLLAVAAVQSALNHAGFETVVADKKSNTRDVPKLDQDRCAAFIGTGVGGTNSLMASHAHQVLSGSQRRLSELLNRIDDESVREDLSAVLGRMTHDKRFNPFVVSMLMPNAPASYVGIKFGLRGGSTSCNYACASGTVAIGSAFDAVRNGHIDTAIAGGAEYLDDPHGSIFLGFDSCGALVRDCQVPDSANRPFDAARSGFLFSQGGAGMLVLESEEHLDARNGEPIAEILASGTSFDAFSMMNPHPQGAAIESMLSEMLNSAHLRAEDVSYINAHGTGTQANDACEAAMIARVFGSTVAVNSTKSLLGHSMGASGAIEAVVTALSLRDQRLHPNRNLDAPIEALNFVTEATSQSIRVAISQSFAFGGHNAAVLMSRTD
ncbi:MAG: 3-oxoacyl-[acyl-carrier-protein] synthase II [Gammaproteobacteria bacterium]|jgi:3-oxoacyl-[acyl-carrier-protein] synthase II